uniref:Uncharacterized protein n=1 Tax=Globodera rostochiensis TaxID=31243 RepID=A0A914HUX6_GLORO
MASRIAAARAFAPGIYLKEKKNYGNAWLINGLLRASAGPANNIVAGMNAVLRPRTGTVPPPWLMGSAAAVYPPPANYSSFRLVAALLRQEGG